MPFIEYITNLIDIPIVKNKIYKISVSQYEDNLSLGFKEFGYTLDSVMKQLKLDTDRVRFVEKYKNKWYEADVLPLDSQLMTKELYKHMVATCTQVGPCTMLECIMKSQPNIVVTHPSSSNDCIIYFYDNYLIYEAYFSGLDSKTLKEIQRIRGRLYVKWNKTNILKVRVMEKRWELSLDT